MPPSDGFPGAPMLTWAWDSTLSLDRIHALMRDAQEAPDINERVNLERPFFLFHIAKTGGSTLRRLLSRSLTGMPTMYPCVTCDCWCHLKLHSRVSYVVDYTACAVAFLGHFMPFHTLPELAGVNAGRHGKPKRCKRWADGFEVPSTPASTLRLLRKSNGSLCVTVLRHPVARAVSHFYEFNAASLNATLPQYYARHGAEALVALTGGNVQTSHLGALRLPPTYDDAAARDDPAVGVATAYRAHQILDSCVVGTQERFDDLLFVLGRLLPRLPVSSAGAQREHATHQPLGNHSRRQELERTHPGFDYDAFSAQLRPLLRWDLELWERATRVAAAQLSVARGFESLGRVGRSNVNL